jgi:steroid delta-isomerase-like uncharacterized protein
LIDIENERVVKELWDASNRQDMETLANLLSDDLVFIRVHLTKQSKEEWLKELLHEWEAFPDAKTEIRTIMSKGNTVMTEADWRGTWKNEYLGRPPTNQVIEFPVAYLFEVEEGKIKQIRSYWNTALIS